MTNNSDGKPDFRLMAVDALRAAGQNDPSSPFYKRTITRPDVHWLRLALLSVAHALGAAVPAIALSGTDVSPVLTVLFAAACFIAVLLIHARVTITELILVYQHFAPEALRCKCRFEPSCSQYMLLSVRKYGAVRGTLKGIDRLKRCAPPNGGFDEP